jgi:hypothetical protein
MKRSVWTIITIFTLSLTGLILLWAGWLQAKTPKAVSDVGAHIKNHDSLTSDAAWRWRRCQPTHWRACLLKHQ